MEDIECRYCRAINNGEERRCTRCGRRLFLAAPRPAPDTYSITSRSMAATAAATAPAFESMPASQPDVSVKERVTYQPSLFRDGLGSPKVIPIPMLTPLQAPGQDRPPARRSAPRDAPPRPRRRPDSRHAGLQPALEFHEAPSPRALLMQTEVIYCDAPVALPAHRMIAAAVDTSAVLLALGLFLATFVLLGGDVSLNRQTVPFLVGLAAVIAMFYRLLWILANGDTPGMCFAGLRLVDFNGRRPDRRLRAVRNVAGLLSLLSAGLGLVWALVDEESLTWHDHISKSFPTAGS